MKLFVDETCQANGTGKTNSLALLRSAGRHRLAFAQIAGSHGRCASRAKPDMIRRMLRSVNWQFVAFLSN